MRTISLAIIVTLLTVEVASAATVVAYQTCNAENRCATSISGLSVNGVSYDVEFQLPSQDRPFPDPFNLLIAWRNPGLANALVDAILAAFIDNGIEGVYFPTEHTFSTGISVAYDRPELAPEYVIASGVGFGGDFVNHELTPFEYGDLWFAGSPGPYALFTPVVAVPIAGTLPNALLALACMAWLSRARCPLRASRDA